MVERSSASDVNGTDMIAITELDFTERQYTIKYYGIADILAKVGGMKASVLPIINSLLPLLAFYFLYCLACIISRKKQDI